ncbi:hypothetical protein SD71_20965 [Cohnella kolymensis]|uniref:Transposase n=1 Tax=Cohnella kolymensis TaxID=1590652 RepID=A0ABR4ZZD4_9BACL|nr:hypothetical protein [Cohnella kolymensis]KIL34156.1 hypothetical protein SD71_20965 [Cohnella kolymensis]
MKGVYMMKPNDLPNTPNVPDEAIREPDTLLANRRELFRKPDDRLRDARDGDPQTLYEDTEPHERLGFRVDDSKPLDLSGNPDTRLEENSGDPY